MESSGKKRQIGIGGGGASKICKLEKVLPNIFFLKNRPALLPKVLPIFLTKIGPVTYFGVLPIKKKCVLAFDGRPIDFRTFQSLPRQNFLSHLLICFFKKKLKQ